MPREREWYIAQDGDAIGPLSASKLAALAATKTSPVLVWAEGLDGWTDAREVEALRDGLGIPSQATAAGNDMAARLPVRKPSVAERARRELIEYSAIAAYLYICFGALILYKASILRGEGILFAPFGLAAAKALILGKFLLLLRAARIGESRSAAGRMVVEIGRKAFVFAALLIVLTVLEEILVGWFHGKTPSLVLAEMTGDSVLQVLATALLMVLVLIPYFAFQEITGRLGEGVLMHMLVERQGGRPQHDPQRSVGPRRDDPA